MHSLTSTSFFDNYHPIFVADRWWMWANADGNIPRTAWSYALFVLFTAFHGCRLHTVQSKIEQLIFATWNESKDENTTVSSTLMFYSSWLFLLCHSMGKVGQRWWVYRLVGAGSQATVLQPFWKMHWGRPPAAPNLTKGKGEWRGGVHVTVLGVACSGCVCHAVPTHIKEVHTRTPFLLRRSRYFCCTNKKSYWIRIMIHGLLCAHFVVSSWNSYILFTVNTLYCG